MAAETNLFEKSSPEQLGNDLFQLCVAQPYARARAMVKAMGPRQLTPHQQKVRAKNRAKRKGRR